MVESSVSFGYWNGGTVWDPDDPVTMEDDHLFFRMRLGGDPRDGSGTAFDSFHWNVLFDLNDDGYKDYWIDTEGSYASNGNPDRVQILYGPEHTQLIASADASRVEEFSASASVDSGNCGGDGYSHTRTYPVGDGSGDWLLDIQVPLTAFNDLSGNQLVYPDSPAPQARVLGLVDDTHTPAAELLEDAVVGDGLADHVEACSLT